MTNNYDWTRGVSLLEFLRDYGKHLTVNYMRAKDSVKSRLESESGISYTEFSYMLLQAFDFVQLSRSHNCRLQVGGSDQWGNITAGVELSHKLGGPRLYGLVAPLLLDANGVKMGKTSTGERIWLDPERTTAFDFYKYWFNVSDAEAPNLVKMFSTRPLDELTELLAEHDRDRAKRLAQRELARALTAWVHGDAAVISVEAANRVMFGGELEGLHDADLAQLAKTISVVEVGYAELEAGIPIVDLLARTVESSKGAARRLVQQNGAYINNKRVTDIDRKITLIDLATESMLVVRSGKKDYCLVRVVRG
jgi:tyrosyl-tRNA synthetase